MVFSLGLAVGLDPEGYGNPDFCWLSIYDTLIWSFAGPIAFAVAVSREAKEYGEERQKTHNFTLLEQLPGFIRLLLVYMRCRL